jgi:predicted transcriptional regulator
MAILKDFSAICRTENMVAYVQRALEKYIKKDEVTKMSVFFTGLSAYLTEPINLFLKGESGIGKTYNTVQALRYFPKQDVWFLGGMSPKNLIHEHGMRLTRDGKPLEEIEKPVKPNRKDFESEKDFKEAVEQYRDDMQYYQERVKGSYTLVDMTKKILVFLEAPDFETFRILLPILSHDKEEIEYRFVDKTEKGLRSQRVVIRGWPATIFLTTDRSYLEDLATRSFTATPESSKDKISEVNAYINERMSFPWEQKDTEEDECIRHLIKAISGCAPLEVIIPFPNLHEIFPKEIVRDMRDFQHFCQFIKPIAALQMFQRPRMELQEGEGDEKRVKKYVIATAEDVSIALRIYSQIFETTRTCTEDRVLKFYHQVVSKRPEWRIRDLVEEWNKVAPKKVSRDWVETALKRLLELGYVDYEPDPNDRRTHLYRPLQLEGEKSEINRKIENRLFLMEIFEKGAENWLNKLSEKIQSVYREKFLENRILIEKLSVEDLRSIIVDREKIFSLFGNQNFSDISKSSKLAENYPIDEKINRESDFRRISDNSGKYPTVESEHVPQQPTLQIRRLAPEEVFRGKCSWCGREGVMEAYADGFAVCGDCLREYDCKLRGSQD